VFERRAPARAADLVRGRAPFAVGKRGGRNLVLTPEGTDLGIAPRHRVDNAMIKALARAFRWRKLLETGAYGNIAELAATEKIHSSYVSRILRLTLLAPDIVEAVLNGKHAPKVTLATLMQPFSNDWLRQWSLWGVCFRGPDRKAYARTKYYQVWTQSRPLHAGF
jgi:hypothetical protein